MKKIIMIGIASVMMMSGAMAQDMYVGVEVGKLKPNMKPHARKLAPSSLKTYSVFMGQGIGNNLSAEVGFVAVSEGKKTYKGAYKGVNFDYITNTMSGRGMYIDFVGNTPKSSGFYGIGTFGVGYMKIENTVKQKRTGGNATRTKFEKSRGAARLGLGVGYDFANGTKGRLMVRHINHKYSNLKSVRTVTFGLTRQWGWSAEKAKQ